ncbi:MAG TPA: acyltransferase [Opitutaceae bacterium]|nr:acyltransferase [Opitutaceae bacterium]
MIPNRIRTLDGIRGIAILMVVAGHCAQNYRPLGEEMRRWLLAFANPGAGVRLFFVLSGYLITHLLLRERTASGTISLLGFYGRRALRIFPAFYAYLLLVGLWQLRDPSGLTNEMWIAASTFTWNYALLWIDVPPQGYWNLGHLWTLALEQQFYLLWPLLLLLCGIRRSLWLAVALIAWCPLARIGTYFCFPEQRGLVVMMFHTGVDSLMMGCAAALLVQADAVRAALRSRGPLFAGVALMWMLVLSPLAGELLRGFPIVLGLTLDALAAAGLIAWLHHSPPAWAESLLGRGLLPLIGVVSYSWYLWQQIFLSPTGPLGRGEIVLPVIASIIAAGLSYSLIERPFLRFRFRLAPRTAPAAVTQRLPL